MKFLEKMWLIILKVTKNQGFSLSLSLSLSLSRKYVLEKPQERIKLTPTQPF